MAKRSKVPLEVRQFDDGGCHLFVSAYIYDHAIRLLVDTGASHTLLDKKIITTLLPEVTLQPNALLATGAGTNNLKSEIAQLPELRIGAVRLKATVAVMDLAHVNDTYRQAGLPEIMGVLGCDILVSNQAILNLKKERLSLLVPRKERKKKS